MAKANDTPEADAPAVAVGASKSGAPTHIRFIGHPSDDENSSTSVFGKVFYRGKWVPLANLNGGNPEKRALDGDLFAKLVRNPAFQLGNGDDSPIPGVTRATSGMELEEA
jgi:hypothetical protein